MDPQHVLLELLSISTVKLFAAQGVRLQPQASSDGLADFAAVVGFSSAPLHGRLALGMGTAALNQLTASHDHNHRYGSQEWLSEMANQLVGRFKGQLLGYGVTVSIALPTVLSGARLQAFKQSGGRLRVSAFDSHAGPVLAWLDVQLEPGFALTQQNDPDNQPLVEGDLTLFESEPARAPQPYRR